MKKLCIGLIIATTLSACRNGPLAKNDTMGAGATGTAAGSIGSMMDSSVRVGDTTVRDTTIRDTANHTAKPNYR